MTTIIKAKAPGEHQVINRLDRREGRGERVVGEVWRDGGSWFATIYDLAHDGGFRHFGSFAEAADHARRMAQPA